MHDNLKGLIRAKGLTYDKVSEELNCTVSSLSNKLNGKYEFTESEIGKMLKILDIPDDDITGYFFRGSK